MDDNHYGPGKFLGPFARRPETSRPTIHAGAASRPEPAKPTIVSGGAPRLTVVTGDDAKKTIQVSVTGTSVQVRLRPRYVLRSFERESTTVILDDGRGEFRLDDISVIQDGAIGVRLTDETETHQALTAIDGEDAHVFVTDLIELARRLDDATHASA